MTELYRRNIAGPTAKRPKWRYRLLMVTSDERAAVVHTNWRGVTSLYPAHSYTGDAARARSWLSRNDYTLVIPRSLMMDEGL